MTTLIELVGDIADKIDPWGYPMGDAILFRHPWGWRNEVKTSISISVEIKDARPEVVVFTDNTTGAVLEFSTRLGEWGDIDDGHGDGYLEE